MYIHVFVASVGEVGKKVRYEEAEKSTESSVNELVS